MYSDYFSMWEFLRYVRYKPNGSGGVYCRPSQKKRRKKLRRMGKGQ